MYSPRLICKKTCTSLDLTHSRFAPQMSLLQSAKLVRFMVSHMPPAASVRVTPTVSMQIYLRACGCVWHSFKKLVKKQEMHCSQGSECSPARC